MKISNINKKRIVCVMALMLSMTFISPSFGAKSKPSLTDTPDATSVKSEKIKKDSWTKISKRSFGIDKIEFATCESVEMYQGYETTFGREAYVNYLGANEPMSSFDAACDNATFDCHCLSSDPDESMYKFYEDQDVTGLPEGTYAYKVCCANGYSFTDYWSEPSHGESDGTSGYDVTYNFTSDTGEFGYTESRFGAESEYSDSLKDSILNSLAALYSIFDDDTECFPGTDFSSTEKNVDICVEGAGYQCEELIFNFECSASGTWESAGGEAKGCVPDPTVNC